MKIQSISGNQVQLTPQFQGNFDYFERKNSTSKMTQKTRRESPFSTILMANQRNNITVKGYYEDKLIAVASLDILGNEKGFIGFYPKIEPLIKQVGSKITVTLQLQGITLSSIKNIKRDF